MTDDEALTALETLWHKQPEAKPWAPVTDYSFEARRQIEGEHPDRIIRAFGKGRYLDWGCGPDAILVRLLRERGVIAAGIDPQLRESWRCFQPEEFRGAYPVIICREVLEHCRLREIPALMRRWQAFEPRFIYVTTRFAAFPEHFLSVDTADTLDPTHITMLTQGFLRLLFVLEGFRRRADLEAVLDWQQKGRCLVYERS